MLNVVCVKLGTKYGPEYVNILFDMVRRNLREGFEGKFWCLTDDPTDLNPEIGILTAPKGLTGWWGKLWLFSPGLFPEGERILYFDLDVCIVGVLEDVAEYQGDFAILKEFLNAPGWQSSVMAWRSGYGHEVWEKWVEQERPEVVGGDQEWIEIVLGKADYLQDLFPGGFLSYKCDCHVGHHPPRGSKVIIFHGEPKPDNCGEQWAAIVWKVGGGTAAELDLVCNTDDEALKKNIQAACKLPLPWVTEESAHEGHAVIVGGAPSVKNFVEELRQRKANGQTIFALNNAYRWCVENNIMPDAQVMLDARAENAAFVPESTNARLYYASQCHPDVFAAAPMTPIYIWHSHTEILDEALIAPSGTNVLRINGGTTVGLSAMALCYALGYRKLHIYGMDSSIAEDKHHAYQQTLNDADRILDVVCEGREFKAAPWMVAQANQFQTLALLLAEMGAEVTVSGDGLLPFVARQIARSGCPDTHITEDENGVYWPSRDKLGQTYIVPSTKQLQRLFDLCERRGLAIQAGGNVGIWAKEFAKRFDRVITFEPDALNFECLSRNCTEDNIEKHNAALGDVPSRKALSRDPSNCGAHTITEGDEFEVVTIDSLALTQCDLIQLDIEGYELFALKGAEKTIEKFHPVICLEMKALGEGFGVSDSKVIEWLSEHGYKQARKMGRDVIFTNDNEDAQCKVKLTDTYQGLTEHP